MGKTLHFFVSISGPQTLIHAWPLKKKGKKMKPDWDKLMKDWAAVKGLTFRLSYYRCEGFRV